MNVTLLSIAVGGMCGAVMRYGCIQFISSIFGTTFPYATITVNIVGSFLLGVASCLTIYLADHYLWLKSFVIIGMLGSFTTFSAFSMDTLIFINEGNFSKAIMYILLSIIFSVCALAAGIFITKGLFHA